MAEPFARRFRRGTPGLLVAGALLATAGLAGCGGSDDGNPVVSGVSVNDDDGMHGAVLTTPYAWPEGTLVDTAGDEAALRDRLDKPLTLVFFGYTKCPDICQAVMANLASANARLDPDQADDVATWFVTTDPARDDPATLRDYLDRFDPGFEGFTGPLQDIVEIANGVHVPIEKGERLPSGGYDVTHGTAILGVTPGGEVPILWTEGTSAAKLAEDIDTFLSDGIPTSDQEADS